MPTFTIEQEASYTRENRFQRRRACTQMAVNSDVCRQRGENRRIGTLNGSAFVEMTAPGFERTVEQRRHGSKPPPQRRRNFGLDNQAKPLFGENLPKEEFVILRLEPLPCMPPFIGLRVLVETREDHSSAILLKPGPAFASHVSNKHSAMIPEVPGCDMVGDSRSRSLLYISVQRGITKHDVGVHCDFRRRIDLESLLIDRGYAAKVAHRIRNRAMN